MAAQPSHTVPRATGVTSAGAGDTVDTTIEQIVASDSLVGRQVRVAGTCLTMASMRPIGAPPRTRSDWQLATKTAAIYVVGPIPPTCASGEPMTIVARVGEYSPPSIGGDTPPRRRYLILVR